MSIERAVGAQFQITGVPMMNWREWPRPDRFTWGYTHNGPRKNLSYVRSAPLS